jgi:hypothetical protein
VLVKVDNRDEFASMLSDLFIEVVSVEDKSVGFRGFVKGRTLFGEGSGKETAQEN